jgi:ABC-type glutathione transport system ATPase component
LKIKRARENQAEGIYHLKLKEKIAILNEQIKAQEQITELYELYFNQNKTTLKELLDQRLKLLELKHRNSKRRNLKLPLKNC